MSDSAGRKVTSHPFTRWTEPDMSGAVRVRSGMLCKLCGQPESAHAAPEPEPCPECGVGLHDGEYCSCECHEPARCGQPIHNWEGEHPMACANLEPCSQHPPAQPHNAAPDPEDRPVRVNRSKEWWMKKAHAEGDTTIGAGVPDSGDRLLRAEANRLTWMFPPTVREDAIHAALEAVVRKVAASICALDCASKYSDDAACSEVTILKAWGLSERPRG